MVSMKSKKELLKEAKKDEYYMQYPMDKLDRYKATVAVTIMIGVPIFLFAICGLFVRFLVE